MKYGKVIESDGKCCLGFLHFNRKMWHMSALNHLQVVKRARRQRVAAAMLNLSMYDPPDYVLNVGQGRDQGVKGAGWTGMQTGCSTSLQLAACCSLTSEETTFTGVE